MITKQAIRYAIVILDNVFYPRPDGLGYTPQRFGIDDEELAEILAALRQELGYSIPKNGGE